MAGTKSYRILPTDHFKALINSNNPSDANPFVTALDINSFMSAIQVDTFSDLPDPTTVPNTFYHVNSSQGSKWKTFKPRGFYYSDGTSTWVCSEHSENATQETVDEGLNDSEFVTPKTLNDASKWGTKSDQGHTHISAEIGDLLEIVQDAFGNSLTNSVDVTFTYDDSLGVVTANLTPTGVSSNTYGSATQTAQVSVDTKGRIVGISNVLISVNSSQISDLSEAIQDTVGGMVIGNTEDGITITYDDSAGVLNFTNTDKGSVAVSSHVSALDPHTQYQLKSEKGQVNGYASLDSNTKIPENQISQSTELVLGGSKVATGTTVANELSTNDTDLITTKKLWGNFVTRFVAKSWTWVLKQIFSTAPQFPTAMVDQILEVDINKDLISVVKKTAYNKDFGTTAGTVMEGNDSRVTQIGQANTLRTWTDVVLANNISRLPSSTNDVEISIIASLTAGIGQSATITIQMDVMGNGVFSNFMPATNENALTITLGLLGGTSRNLIPLNFTVPRGTQYKYVVGGSGTVTISTHKQLIK